MEDLNSDNPKILDIRVETTLLNNNSSDASSSSNVGITGKKRLHGSTNTDQNKRSKTAFAESNAEQEHYFLHAESSGLPQQNITPIVYPSSDQLHETYMPSAYSHTQDASTSANAMHDNFLRAYVECTETQLVTGLLDDDDHTDASNVLQEESNLAGFNDEAFGQWLEEHIESSPIRTSFPQRASSTQLTLETQPHGEMSNDDNDDHP